eukprot:CAMPEP_0116994618 /NCGR_PEP_ID=MMETSP0467-20121206/68246_1 /TAXON_ID=283647 /ORGANISM="Mesodinium pulex, Strain SPMC105" /LENGTH=245 /DNA_ID=CAMNT_0004692737 /DNA_START=687 /DNA_END=1424 /DNA_ORIENTATION=-
MIDLKFTLISQLSFAQVEKHGFLLSINFVDQLKVVWRGSLCNDLGDVEVVHVVQLEGKHFQLLVHAGVAHAVLRQSAVDLRLDQPVGRVLQNALDAHDLESPRPLRVPQLEHFRELLLRHSGPRGVDHDTHVPLVFLGVRVSTVSAGHYAGYSAAHLDQVLLAGVENVLHLVVDLGGLLELSDLRHKVDSGGALFPEDFLCVFVRQLESTNGHFVLLVLVIQEFDRGLPDKRVIVYVIIFVWTWI